MIHSKELEEAILGSLLAVPSLMDQAKVEIIDEMFYDPTMKAIYQAMNKIQGEIDVITVTEQLRKEAKLEAIGGIYAVSKLLQADIYGNFNQKCAILKQKYTRRMSIEIGMQLQKIGGDDTRDELDSFEAIDKAHQRLSSLLFGQKQAETFEDVAMMSLAELRDRVARARSGEIPGIRTGVGDLDKITGGWIPGDLVVLAGRPGMGKTALALHCVKQAATQNKKVYLFSLEMTNTRLVDRMILGGTNVDSYKYKMGRLTDEEIEGVTTWVVENTDMPVYLDEKAMVTVDYIVSRCRMMKRKNNLDMVIIDYLQLIDMQQNRGDTRDQAIGMVTRKLKAMAKELKVPVILLSQLNRMVEDRSDKRPSLRDLRESGNIEQDTDLVLFIYRPAYYDIKEANGKDSEGLIILDIAKHRNGAANIDVEFYHNESLTKFFDELTTNIPF